MRCTDMKEELKKRDPYWLDRDCVDCVQAYEDKMERMREGVRGNARRLREEFGLPEPETKGGRNRRGHMDVGR